jgi:hypothetical protein
MPFSKFRVLPTRTQGIETNNINVPNVIQPSDVLGTTLAVQQERRLQQDQRIKEERFAYEKAVNRTKILDSVAQFGSSTGADGSGGLKGYTPFSQRVASELAQQKQHALNAMATTEDPAEIEAIGFKFRAAMEGNPEYTKALNDDLFVDEAMKTFTDPKNIDKYDPFEVEGFLSELKNMDSRTGETYKDDARVGVRDIYFGKDFTSYDLADTDTFVKGLGKGQEISKEVENPDGTRSVQKSLVRMSPERAQDAALAHVKNPKVARELSKLYGTTNPDELASILVQQAGVYPSQDTDKDGLVKDTIAITNINSTTTEDRALATEAKVLSNEKTRQDIANANKIANSGGIDVDVYETNKAQYIKQGYTEAMASRKAARDVAISTATQANVNYKSDKSANTVRDSNKAIISSTFNKTPVTVKEIKDIEGIDMQETKSGLYLVIKGGSDEQLQWLIDKEIVPANTKRVKDIKGYANGQVRIKSDQTDTSAAPSDSSKRSVSNSSNILAPSAPTLANQALAIQMAGKNPVIPKGSASSPAANTSDSNTSLNQTQTEAIKEDAISQNSSPIKQNIAKTGQIREELTILENKIANLSPHTSDNYITRKRDLRKLNVDKAKLELKLRRSEGLTVFLQNKGKNLDNKMDEIAENGSITLKEGSRFYEVTITKTGKNNGWVATSIGGKITPIKTRAELEEFIKKNS